MSLYLQRDRFQFSNQDIQIENEAIRRPLIIWWRIDDTHTNIDKEQSCRIHFERINLFFFIRLFLFEKWSKSDFISLTKQKEEKRKYNIQRLIEWLSVQSNRHHRSPELNISV